MSNVRTNSISFNAGTFAPKKYVKYTVEYVDLAEGYTATYTYYGSNDVALARVRLTFDGQGRDTQGELLDALPV